jgi:hypothetical protein
MTPTKMHTSLWDASGGPLRQLPRELVWLVVMYLRLRPPSRCLLPSRMLTEAPSLRCSSFEWLSNTPEGRLFFVESLVGSSVFVMCDRISSHQGYGGPIVHEEFAGPIACSPFLVVWATIYEHHTYFGMVFPSIVYDTKCMSLAFGPDQDTRNLGLPRQDCSIVFYDLRVADRPSQQLPVSTVMRGSSDVRHSISRIRSLNLSRGRQFIQCNQDEGEPTKPLSLGHQYSVFVVRIPGLLLDGDFSCPFHHRPHRVDLFAHADHPTWPWYEHQPAVSPDASSLALDRSTPI